MSGIESVNKDFFAAVQRKIFQDCKLTKGLTKYILDNGIHAEKDEDQNSASYTKWKPEGIVDELVSDIGWLYMSYLGYPYALSSMDIDPAILFPADVVLGCCDCFVENPNYYEHDAFTVHSMYEDFNFKDFSWLLKYKSSVIGACNSTELNIPDYLSDYQVCHIYGNTKGENFLETSGKGTRYNGGFVDNICNVLLRKVEVIDHVYLFTNPEDCKYSIRRYDVDGKVVLLVYPNFYDVR